MPLCLGQSVPTSLPRAGVIPYTWHGQKLWFLLGIDKRTRDLSDFGGGRRRNETTIDAAYREFTEETCGMFKENLLTGASSISAKKESSSNVFRRGVTKDRLQRCVALHDSTTNALFFVNIAPEWKAHTVTSRSASSGQLQTRVIDNDVASTFRVLQDQMVHSRANNEHIGIKWVSEDQFWNLAFGDNLIMWRQLQDFLRKNTTSLELKVFLVVDNSLKRFDTKLSANSPSFHYQPPPAKPRW